MFVMVHLNVWFKHANIFEITEVFTSICIVASMCIRKTVLIQYGSTFEDVIQKHSQFWDYGLFGTKTESRLRKNMEFCFLLLKCFIISGIASIIVRCFSPLFMKELLLPQDCWIPGNQPVAKKIIYVLQIIFYIESMTYTPLFDGLYIIMTGNLKSQLILLQKAIESIDLKRQDDETSWRRVKECCQHHKFLLRSSNLTQIVESILVAIVMNTLLIMICIPGSEIEIEADRLITQIYNLNWCKFLFK
nr:PREDICTED: uncharacterized protein LOC107397893 isoform X2 [Tribolium castaneum]|eukprot:XP_015835255.1 PREDICTED: uncharacterized protein LOC107397893 isoform X2 [Tribolium castaneum]